MIWSDGLIKWDLCALLLKFATVWADSRTLELGTEIQGKENNDDIHPFRLGEVIKFLNYFSKLQIS